MKAAQIVASLRGGAGELAIPAPFVQELSRLTDKAAPTPLSIVQGVLNAELGYPRSAMLDKFESVPIAAGSIAQVHCASVRRDDNSDKMVAVKVQHGYLAGQVESDLNVFRSLGSMITLPGGHDIRWLV